MPASTKIIFESILDDVQQDVHELNKLYTQFSDTSGMPIPRKGELIKLLFVRDNRVIEYTLEVSKLTYLYHTYGATITIELNIPTKNHINLNGWITERQREDRNDWIKWFKKFRFGDS